ncbi:HAD family hydrolase [Chloroflexota bacterium]
MPESRAVIWDMDGVIAYTAPYHLKSWQEVFQKRGVDFTEEDFKRYFGQRNDTIIKSTLGEEISEQELDATAEEKERSFRRRIGQNIKPLPGVIELMTSLKQLEFKMALASSAPMENIQLIIKTLGINNCFQYIVAGRDVTEGKPSPQIFIFAANKLRVKPEDCIVIEDSIAGVTAAKRAGMHCLAVTTTHPRPSLTKADLIIDTLVAVSVKDLEKLLKNEGV